MLHKFSVKCYNSDLQQDGSIIDKKINVQNSDKQNRKSFLIKYRSVVFETHKAWRHKNVDLYNII